MPERLQKIISSHGLTSRREAERLIRDGRVFVNGVKAVIGQSADAGIDEIVVDGTLVAAKSDGIYIMLNKPRGYLTSAGDDRGRKTVMDLVSGVGQRIYPVGRLDMESEGLLLLTNDGLFANTVAHPSFNKTKTYEVRVTGDLEHAVQKLRLPMLVDGYEVHAKSVSIVRKFAGGGVLSVSIGEGRNRQVRKMCSSCGLEVRALTRVSIGPLELGSLEVGSWRHLTESERKALCS
ncbi:MAG: rRNA pseudouridine synthase [Oscillospiraceae bacterium]|nr:rRNA pseudouridine synthase [Oscillospiraceae bacterium]